VLVPPCINKFYILDLQPENSLIRYAVEQGHRTFVLSWRNPDESCKAWTWDDYVEQAVIRAIQVVQEISSSKTLNTLGFCVGGTLLATALGVLAARGQQPAASLTLLTTLIDFSSNGVLDLFVDEASVRLREMSIGPDAPQGPGLLQGKELAATFSFLRPNDLVWNYVVGNYLRGEAPPAFDLLYWNGDSTNLPGPMYCWYLRHTYLQNELRQPGALTVCGESLDLGKIKAPVYIYGSREDHIVPWDSAYRSTQIFTGKKRFVLGASGHIAGVINPPAKGKRSHWIGKTAALPEQAQQWLDRLGQLAVFPCRCHEAGSAHPGWARPQGHRAGARPLRQDQSLNRRERSMSTDIVIVAAARTAIGKFGGSLAKTPASELGATVVQELLKRARLEGRPGRRGHPGPGLAGRLWTEPRAPDRDQGRSAACRAGHDHQQGLRLRPQGRDAGDPGHPRRRQRDRDCRRPGEHEPLAPCAAGLARRPAHG
jgi:poly(3-hydroxyalkanoate) synthetase